MKTANHVFNTLISLEKNYESVASGFEFIKGCLLMIIRYLVYKVGAHVGNYVGEHIGQ